MASGNRGKKYRPRVRYVGGEASVQHFWSLVDRGEPDACWPWAGLRNAGGYGTHWFEIDGRRAHYGAHVIACSLSQGTPATSREGRTVVMHSCDNPVCCNPNHLRFGTVSENLRDMRAKGRLNTDGYARGERHARSKLTEAAVREIRRRHSAGAAILRLAVAFGVRRWTIEQIVKRVTWKHVPDTIEETCDALNIPILSAEGAGAVADPARAVR